MQPYELNLEQASAAIASGEISPVELTESCLARMEACEGSLNAMVTVTAEKALEQAGAAEREIAEGRHRGPLHGIPYGAKDLYDTAGIRTTSSSAVRENHIPDRDSAAVERLQRAGMILLGKTHTHEFAFGGTTPTTRNPWDVDRVPGGSSGGTGAGVAAGYFTTGLGSDTGGSIRIPASVCGTVGLKPTFGRTSRAGVASLSWSLDHVGPLARNVRDTALTLNVLAGYDPRDPGSANVPVPDFTEGIDHDIAGLRIGIPTNYYTEQVDPEVSAAVEDASRVFESLGAALVPVTVPTPERIKAIEWTLMMAEASAYHREALRATPDRFTDEVRALLEVGETILATDYVDAHRHRQQMKQAWSLMMQDVDVVLAPATPTTALPAADPVFRHADGTEEHATEAYVRLSAPANLTGLPSISVPCGFDSNGLPIGMQILGKAFAESVILRAAFSYERSTEHVGLLAPLETAVAGLSR